MQSYQAARTYFGLLEFLSWCLILFGVFIAVIAMGAVGQMSRGFGGSPMAGLAGLVPGFAIAFLGFLGLAGVQIGRAGVDTAEFTQQGLKVARDQLEVSQQALKQGAALEKGYAALVAAKEELRRDAEPPATTPPSRSTAAKPVPKPGLAIAQPPLKITDYRGTQIRKHEQGYYVGSSFFADFSGAKRHIDQTVDETSLLSADLSAAIEEAMADIGNTDTNAAPEASGATRT